MSRCLSRLFLQACLYRGAHSQSFDLPQFHVTHDEQFTMVSGTLLEVDSVFDPKEWNSLLRLGGHECHTELVNPTDDLQPFEDFYDDFLGDDDDNSSFSAVPEGEETDVSDDEEDEDETFELEDLQENEGVDEPHRTWSGHQVIPTVRHAGAR